MAGGHEGGVTVAAAEPAAAQLELLGFQLADEVYAVDVLEVKEIVRLQPITPVPRAPAWLRGIVTLRGVIVPIFDLRRRLGLEEIEHGDLARFVVVYRGEEYAGLIVDRITQVMRVPATALEPPPQTLDAAGAEYLRGVVRHREQLVIVLNLARVLEVGP